MYGPVPEQAGFLAPFSKEKPKAAKPASMNKKDVLAFVRQSFDASIDTVSKLTPEQISKTYSGGEGTMTGLLNPANVLSGLTSKTSPRNCRSTNRPEAPV